MSGTCSCQGSGAGGGTLKRGEDDASRSVRSNSVGGLSRACTEWCESIEGELAGDLGGSHIDPSSIECDEAGVEVSGTGAGATCEGSGGDGEDGDSGTGKARPEPVALKSPISAESIPDLIQQIIKFLLGMVGAVALLMFVYGGLIWLTSGGSPDKIKKGMDVVIWASIGLIVIFTSYTLVDFVFRVFGVN